MTMARRAIGRALLGAVLVLAASIQVAAQAQPEPKREEPLTMAQAAAAALLNALEALPSVIWPDEPAPASLAESVPLARERMWDRAFDSFPWPLHLRFIEARCGATGAVALVFEEIRPLLPMRTYAVAWRGSMPSSTDDDWAGSTGMASVRDDPELDRILGADTGPCP
jgi:hypothetical protein